MIQHYICISETLDLRDVFPALALCRGDAIVWIKRGYDTAISLRMFPKSSDFGIEVRLVHPSNLLALRGVNLAGLIIDSYISHNDLIEILPCLICKSGDLYSVNSFVTDVLREVL